MTRVDLYKLFNIGAVCHLHVPRYGRLKPDNILARCADCGRAIEHRPDLPAEVPTLCACCALVRLRPGSYA